MQVARFRRALLVLASGLVTSATISLTACQQSQPPTSPASPEQKPATTEIFVTFEGPWAIVPDPKNAAYVIAIAPRTKSHAPLAVVPANVHLDAGIYDLAVPPSDGANNVTVDKKIFQAHVDPEAAQRALDSKGRYVVRLPKPAAYVAETHHLSRVGSTYPAAASTEQDYASAIALRYNVASTAGFQLAGTNDAGVALSPVLLELSTRVVRFTVDPIQAPLMDEPCHNHAREAFHDLTRLVGLVLYVDFPNSPAACSKTDPQAPRSEKTQSQLHVPTPLTEETSTAELRTMGLENIQGASMSGAGFTVLDFALQKASRGLGTAFYFFHSEGGACLAPIILGM